MFKVLTKGCEPSKGSKYSAAIDLYASEDVTIGAGEIGIVGLGVCIDKDKIFDVIKRDYQINSNGRDYEDDINCVDDIDAFPDVFMSSHYIQLEPRSSLRAKGLIVGTGIIDLDFIGHELELIVHNPTTLKNIHTNHYANLRELNTFTIHKGDKIAQAMLCEHKTYLIGIHSDVKRDGGIGSSGA